MNKEAITESIKNGAFKLEKTPKEKPIVGKYLGWLLMNWELFNKTWFVVPVV